MEKENDILNPRVFNFSIFPIREVENVLQAARGSNQKKIAIVLEASTDSKENLAFLSKILAAIRVEMTKDVLLFNVTPEKGFSLAALKQQCPVDYLLGFGSHPSQWGIHAKVERYHSIQLLGTHLLWADSLDQIAQQQELKKALWQQLKQLFPV